MQFLIKVQDLALILLVVIDAFKLGNTKTLCEQDLTHNTFSRLPQQREILAHQVSQISSIQTLFDM